MFLVKVLEKKSVIRTFGLALVLAPIVNTLVKMAMLADVPNRWSFAMFWRIIVVGSVPNQILYVATIIIGILMLRGTATVWKYALMLLGGYVLLQLSDFKHVKSSAVTWMFFITNILTFIFVADQLVWKVKAPLPKKKPNPKKNLSAPKPAYRVIPKVRKKILFQFAGGGPWGQLMGISSQGIHVRGLTEPPSDIATREIEISLNNGLTLRTRLARRKEHDYYFDYTSLSSEGIQSLNKWLQSLSDVA